MNIDIIHFDGHKKLRTYESDFVPNIGDRFAGVNFEDNYARTVIHRLIFPSTPGYINIYVDYTYPQLVTKEILTDAEADLLTQEKLS